MVVGLDRLVETDIVTVGHLSYSLIDPTSRRVYLTTPKRLIRQIPRAKGPAAIDPSGRLVEIGSPLGDEIEYGEPGRAM